jgi:hypothetical protein
MTGLKMNGKMAKRHETHDRLKAPAHSIIYRTPFYRGLDFESFYVITPYERKRSQSGAPLVQG